MNAHTKQMIEQRRLAATRLIQESEQSAQRFDEVRTNAAKRVGQATATLSEVATQLEKVSKKSS